MVFWRRKSSPTLSSNFVDKNRARLAPIPDQSMSENDKVSCVKAVVLDQADWDFALNTQSALENSIAGANYFDISVPFSQEQESLNNFLIENLAGQKIAMYAWGVFVDIYGRNKIAS